MATPPGLEALWRRYDAAEARLSAPLSERMLELAGLRPGMRVLDLATGRGEPAVRAAKRVAPGGEVVGIDPDAAMLRMARERADAEGVRNLRLIEGGASSLADHDAVPPGAPFQAVLCRWGLQYMELPVDALVAARKAMAPGAKLVLAVWGQPELVEYWSLPRRVLSRFVAVQEPDMNAPGTFFYADEARLRRDLQAAGFAVERSEELHVPVMEATSDAELVAWCKDFGMGRLLAEVPRDAQDAWERELVTEAAGHRDRGSGMIRLGGITRIVVACRRPDRDSEALLRVAAEAALEYAGTIDARRAAPDAEALTGLALFREALGDAGSDAVETLRLLHAAGSPATMASTGARYFGFVNGATLPAALGAAWLTAAWDQNAALPAMSPVASELHDVVRGWLVDVLRLPASTGVAFVSGATVANASCLAAARDALLYRMGWDVQADGLFGAPPLDVVVCEKAHSTLAKSLGLVGLGRRRVHVVPADDQGRLRAELLPDLPGPVLVCAQAGEVNTGAFDPFDAIADWLAARPKGGWLHVDGAFGLWALADPSRAALVKGLDRADSWATDGHKWLNVTYDCGIAFVRDLADLRRTFTAAAGYLPPADGAFEAMHHTPQSSQRARQVEVWAALRTLGRRGVADLVARACDAAALIGQGLRAAGLTVLNDVVLNQVLVRHVDGPTTEALIAAVQADGRIWCGATQWGGATAMRVSVSSWKTTLDDARLAADVIVELARRVAA
ncbi:pyridoxal phosphate-dependent transferase [Hyaloraphidium curvatum]|nr:pyridoxal phosphate-dependent transferase [Hyaloraphidium curvatum]